MAGGVIQQSPVNLGRRLYTTHYSQPFAEAQIGEEWNLEFIHTLGSITLPGHADWTTPAYNEMLDLGLSLSERVKIAIRCQPWHTDPYNDTPNPTDTGSNDEDVSIEYQQGQLETVKALVTTRSRTVDVLLCDSEIFSRNEIAESGETEEDFIAGRRAKFVRYSEMLRTLFPEATQVWYYRGGVTAFFNGDGSFRSDFGNSPYSDMLDPGDVTCSILDTPQSISVTRRKIELIGQDNPTVAKGNRSIVAWFGLYKTLAGDIEGDVGATATREYAWFVNGVAEPRLVWTYPAPTTANTAFWSFFNNYLLGALPPRSDAIGSSFGGGTGGNNPSASPRGMDKKSRKRR